MELACCGHLEDALKRLRALWGGVLRDGATTFYEVYDPSQTEDKYCMFYGRGLCHAWGAGPASILPELLFGVRPLEDGWKRFTAHPFPHFDRMNLTVPTPYGEILLEYANGKLNVRNPENTEYI